MFCKLIFLVIIFSCKVEWIHCGKATVPHQPCERAIIQDIYYKELNITVSVDDSVFKDADFMLSLLRQHQDFFDTSACNNSAVDVTVSRTIDRYENNITVHYIISMGIKEGHGISYSVLANIDNCYDSIANGIIPQSEFRTKFSLNISGDIYTADYFTNTGDSECAQNSCPPGSKDVNMTCECSPGTYLVIKLKTCRQCPKDMYQEKTGMFNCTPCEEESTTLNKTGSWNSTDCVSDNPVLSCKKGKYLNNVSKTCLPCPKNEYKDIPGNTPCKKCPNGQVTHDSGASDVSSCMDEDTNNALAIALPISAFVVIVVAGILFFYLWRRRKRQRAKTEAEFIKQFVIVENPEYRYVTPDHSDEETEEEAPSTTLGCLAQDIEKRNLEIPRDCVNSTGVRLGRGMFGEVKQVLVRKPEEREMLCAAKMARGSNSRDLLEDMLDELEIHLKLETQHENVVNLIGVCSTPKGPFYLILEYCDNGSLIEYLRSHEEIPEYVNTANRETLSLEWKLSRTLEICNGMKYLASHKIVHRDLAARNVLLDSNTVAKISDFGMAKDVYLKSYYKQRHEGSFPLRWMSIDAIQNLDFNEKTDVWSFGVLIWEVFTDGKLPYYNIIDDQKVALYILNGKKLKRPENCPKYLYNVMLKCWSNKSFNRPKFWELYDNLKETIPHHSKKSSTRRVSREMMRRLSDTKRSLKRKMSRKGSMPSIRSIQSNTNSRKASQSSLGFIMNDLQLERLQEVPNAMFNSGADKETKEEVNFCSKKKKGLLREDQENFNKSKKDVPGKSDLDDDVEQNHDVAADIFKPTNKETPCNSSSTNKFDDDIRIHENNNHSAKNLDPSRNVRKPDSSNTEKNERANLQQDGTAGNPLNIKTTNEDTHINSPDDLKNSPKDSMNTTHDMLDTSDSGEDLQKPFPYQHNNNKDLGISVNTKDTGPDEEGDTFTKTVDDGAPETSDTISTQSVEGSTKTDHNHLENAVENTTRNNDLTSKYEPYRTTDSDDLNNGFGDTSETTLAGSASEKDISSEKMNNDNFPEKNLNNNGAAIDYAGKNEQNNTKESSLDRTGDGQESSDGSDFLSDVLNAANVLPSDEHDIEYTQNKTDEEDNANSSSC